MNRLRYYLPLLDLRDYRAGRLGKDLYAATVLTFLAVPQGIAYALIAGLPPVMGLYAAALPVVMGSLFRGSQQVVSGPTNAVSLLVGSAVAAGIGGSPAQIAITLAFVVGLFQIVAGLLRLGVIVDYISGPVVLGYISGAAVLIGAGQLPNVTGTEAHRGSLPERVMAWIGDQHQAQLGPIVIAAASVLLLLLLRRINRRLPGALILMLASIVASYVLDLRRHGVTVVADLSPVPAGLPSVSLPNIAAVAGLLPAGIACTVLSLVESTSVARSIASRRGERLDISSEFLGQGLANVTAAFFSGYPVGGSLSRSALNDSIGGTSRLAGALSGLLMLVVLLVLGPLVDLTPVATLSGLLFVVIADLIDVKRITSTVRSSPADMLAFLTTLIGTWTLPLDLAIYLGAGISIVLFLRRARLLIVRRMAIDQGGHLREVEESESLQPSQEHAGICRAIRILHLEGALFFGAAGELQAALDEHVRDQQTRVLIVRLKRTHAMDATTAAVFRALARRLEASGRHLILAGMRESTMRVLERTGVAEQVGQDNLFPTASEWFAAMERAMSHALELAGEHACADPCPIAAHVAALGKTAP
ncbi:MAG: SulP family inorganic anion transporter [Proteobacteria bacterium]|nr:SulP family inorganic anion transporter [Pseudomonadota bacterium]